MKPEDLTVLREIHKQYYEDEFEFPDFEQHFLCAYIITDDDNNIITAGGLRQIPEIVLITDKRQSIRDRREALLEVLQANMFIADKYKHTQLHAFIQEDGWCYHLEKVGFRLTKGKSLVLDI